MLSVNIRYLLGERRVSERSRGLIRDVGELWE